MVTPSQSSGSPVRTTGEKQAASLVELTRAAAYTEPDSRSAGSRTSSIIARFMAYLLPLSRARVQS